MKRLSLFFTVLVLAAIAGTGYWYTTLNKEEFDHSRWLSNSFDNVRSIQIESAEGNYTLDLLKDEWKAKVSGSSWNIEARALPEKIRTYLGTLSDLTPNRSTGGFDRGGPEEYGLDSPDLKIIVAFNKTNMDPLVIKMISDGGGVVYGWNSRSPGLVYEFGKQVMDGLNLPFSSFLDKRVFRFDEEKVSKVQLVQPFGSSWLVDKTKEGYFFSLPGYLKGKPASDSDLKLYIHSLALLKAGAILLEPVAVENRIPALTIRIWSGNEGEPATVDFYPISDTPDRYLGKSSWLTVPFTLDAPSVSQLVKSAFDVQGRSIINLDLGKVSRFIISHGENNYAMDRGQTGWRLLDSKKDLPGIDMFLWRFTELQFEALPLNNLPDSAMELMVCKLVDKDGEILKELTFYADPKLPQGQCWLKNGGGMYYPVSSRLLKDLQGMFPAGAASGTNGS